MGGFIALTVRFSDGVERRTSCWTNILPEGLFSNEFYFEETSEPYVRKWLDHVLEHRKKDKEVEEMWGGWNKLAPDDYGLVLLDYKTKTLIAGNGYTDPLQVYTFAHSPAKIGKFLRLYEAGLLTKVDVENRDEQDRDKRWRLATKGDLKRFVDAVSDKVYFDPKEDEWSYTNAGAEDHVAKLPLMIGQIKLWLKKVLCFDHEPDKWEEAYKWVKANFELKPKETKAWASWMRERAKV